MADHFAEIRWTKEYDFKHPEKIPGRVLNLAYGLYMFVENLTVASKKEAIYIGIIKGDQRDYRKRMNEHRKDWLDDIQNNHILVKFGFIYASQKVDAQFIEDIESVLILANQPPENDKKKASFTFTHHMSVKNVNAGGYIETRSQTRDFDLKNA